MPKKTPAETKRRARVERAKAAIESQEMIKEVQTKGFEVVRLSRVRYRDNPYVFIDLRYFNRGFGEDGEEVFHPTTKGVQIKEELFLKLVNQTVLLGLKRLMTKDRG